LTPKKRENPYSTKENLAFIIPKSVAIYYCFYMINALLYGNLNSKDFTTVNAAEAALEEYLGDEERGLYEITRYINDVNREYVQVMMERDGSGVLSTAYVYGNERLSIRSTKKESGYYLYDGRGSVTGIVSILG